MNKFGENNTHTLHVIFIFFFCKTTSKQTNYFLFSCNPWVLKSQFQVYLRWINVFLIFSKDNQLCSVKSAQLVQSSLQLENYLRRARCKRVSGVQTHAYIHFFFSCFIFIHFSSFYFLPFFFYFFLKSVKFSHFTSLSQLELS